VIVAFRVLRWPSWGRRLVNGALRQVAPALPVAVVSAHVLDGAPAGLLGPADRYLEKPLRVDQLMATATALIGRGRPLSDDLRRGNLRAWL
jgi:DNA-binding response OmpR family regulator